MLVYILSTIQPLYVSADGYVSVQWIMKFPLWVFLLLPLQKQFKLYQVQQSTILVTYNKKDNGYDCLK